MHKAPAPRGQFPTVKSNQIEGSLDFSEQNESIYGGGSLEKIASFGGANKRKSRKPCRTIPDSSGAFGFSWVQTDGGNQAPILARLVVFGHGNWAFRF